MPGASYILAFRGLPLILVMSALSSLFFYRRIIPAVVNAFSWLLQRTLGIGGVEGLGCAANVFVGMVEAPLRVRPYLREISRSGLFTLMTCGMATIAGTVMVLYASLPKGALTERSRLIMVYAMCGFANLGSLGIMIGGMGAMAKERRPEIVDLGIRSIVGGTIATCMTGCLVGILY